MKLIVMMISIVILFSPLSFAQSAKEVGKKLITAYKKKDAETIKKHMGPMMALTMNDKFFEDKDLKKDIENLKNWNGKIKEVRYFATVFGAMAALHYDNAKDKDKVRVFILGKFKKTWMQGIGGFDTMDKAKFLALSKKEITKKTIKKKKKGGKKKPLLNKPNKSYSIEMADGPSIKNPSVKALKKSLATLNDDNFVLTLNGPKGFMQTSYTEKGLDIQYKDDNGHFTAKDLISAETAASMFIGYIKNESGWKSKCEWKPFE